MKIRDKTLVGVIFLLTACASSSPQSPETNSLKTTEKDIAAASDVKYMSYSELESCGVMAKALQTGQLQHAANSAKLAKLKADLHAEDDVLEAERKTVNMRKSKQVNAFNHSVTLHRANVSQFNEEVGRLNQDATELNLKKNKMNLECAERPYRNSDLQRLAPELRAAIEAHSNTSEISKSKDNHSMQGSDSSNLERNVK